MIEKELYKYRSYAGCITSAYNLMCGHFKTIFRKTWIAALVFSVAFGIWTALVPSVAEFTSWGGLVVQCLLPTLLFLMVLLGADAWMTGAFATLQNEDTPHKNFFRSLKALLVVVCVSFVLSLLFTVLLFGTVYLFFRSKLSLLLASDFHSMLAWLAVLVAVGVVVLPLAYSFVKYLVGENHSLKKMVGSDYREGWKHWGFLFVVSFIAVTILVLVSIVVQSPTFLLQTAKAADAYGVSLGDTPALPSYFKALHCAVAALTQFLAIYAWMGFYWVLFYAYGTIEEKKNARKQAEQNVIMQ